MRVLISMFYYLPPSPIFFTGNICPLERERESAQTVFSTTTSRRYFVSIETLLCFVNFALFERYMLEEKANDFEFLRFCCCCNS